MTYSELVDALIAAREEKQINQSALGRRLGLARQTISNWEAKRRQPGFDELQEWAKAVGVRLEVQLVRGTPGAHERSAELARTVDLNGAQLIERLLRLWPNLNERDRAHLHGYIGSVENLMPKTED